jgi:hypothetical protein
MSLDIYETWSQLVKKHTVGGACNFQDAACELALLVADHEWDRAIAIAKDMENELQLWGKGYRDDSSDQWIGHDNAVQSCLLAIRSRGKQ